MTQKDTPQPTGRKERWINIFALKCRRKERERKKKRRRERIRFQDGGKTERNVERGKMREQNEKERQLEWEEIEKEKGIENRE